MLEGESNFIKNRKWKLKNPVRFVFLVLSIWWGLGLPWANSVLAEKIIMGVLCWIYLCFVLFYATNDRMKSRKKRNAFYSWSGYCMFWLMCYIIYRFIFANFHYLLIIYVTYGFVQTLLWISGVLYNIRKNKYMNEILKHLGINAFTIVTMILGVGILVASGCILGFMGIETLKIVLTMLVLCVQYMFLATLTFLVQWWIMKKYDYDETLE